VTEARSSPETIGRYELITRLATGGMAEIFLARERGLAGLERLVVIKRILPHLAHEESFVEMFLREARIIARLNHPNVVQIYELGEDAGSYFIALEYIHGCSVRELQLIAERAEREIPLSVALSVVTQACRGAHAAHELCDADGRPLGLVHRDISPHNLMVTPQGHVKLLDFGVARAAEGFEATSSGNLKGKYGYMSPEQCLHETLDRRSDVYALGITLWELCAGRRLYHQKTEIEILHAIVHNDAPRVTEHADVPEVVADVVATALANDREDRYVSAEAMRSVLEAAAREAELELGTDAVAAFMRDVAQGQLEARNEVLDRARENTINSMDVARLTRVTSSTGPGLGEPTVAARPSVTTGGGRRELSVDTDEPALASPDSKNEGEGDDGGPRDAADSPPAADSSETEPEPVTEPAAGTGRPRWQPLAAVGLALLLLLGVGYWLFAAQESPTTDEETGVTYAGEPLVLGFAPTVDDEILRDEMEPLRVYLEERLERPVELTVTEDYNDLAERVVDGRLPYGWFPPLLFVRTTSKPSGDSLRVVVIKEFDGAVSSDGYLLVRRGEPFDDVADLEGRVACFTDPNSTSGNFLPRAWLRQKGVIPDEFLGGVHWSGSHLQGLRDLLAGKCDLAATYSGAYLTAGSYDIPSGQLSIFAVTGNIPQDVLAAGPAADDEELTALRQALLDFSPRDHAGVERLGDSQRITGFEPLDPSYYDSLRAAAKRVPITSPDDDDGENENPNESNETDDGAVENGDASPE